MNSTLHELLANLAESYRDALRALATHLNHDQITGTLETFADDAEALAVLLRELEAFADKALPDETPPEPKTLDGRPKKQVI